MTAMLATKANPRFETDKNPWRCSFPLPEEHELGRSPVVLGRPTSLIEAILAEFRSPGAPEGPPDAARLPLPEEDAPAAPPAVTDPEDGTEAIIVVIDRPMVQFLFGEPAGSRLSFRLLVRARRAGACENQVCDTATATATATNARRLLIVCDSRQVSAAERTRAIRWIRRAAHRIGYECSINGLQGLGTSYTVVVADTTDEHAARSVVEWYRGATVR